MSTGNIHFSTLTRRVKVEISIGDLSKDERIALFSALSDDLGVTDALCTAFGGTEADSVIALAFDRFRKAPSY